MHKKQKIIPIERDLTCLFISITLDICSYETLSALNISILSKTGRHNGTGEIISLKI
jgi:hypothetical protein